jgi:diadenosine tetraphosphate (Ap4A) HIT family hydrolase
VVSTCSFCAEVAGSGVDNLFHELLGPEVGCSYLVDETAQFVVVPSVGALVAGYCLILPRRHVSSFGHLDAAAHGELSALIDRARDRLRTAFGGEVVVYEHGAMSPALPGGSCADHAHLHVVPVPPTVDLATPFFDEHRVHPSADLPAVRAQAARGMPYLLLVDPRRGWLLADAPRVGASHSHV